MASTEDEQAAIYEALYEAVPDPVITVNRDMIITHVNPAAMRRFGYAEQDMLGQSSRLLYATDADRQRCFDELTGVDFSQEAPSGIHRYRDARGTIFHARMILKAFGDRDAPDWPKGYVGIIHDITEFLENDEARRQSDSLLVEALDVIPDGLAIFDRDDRLLLYNQAFLDKSLPVKDVVRKGAAAEDILRAAQAAGFYPEMPVGDPGVESWIHGRMAAFRVPTGETLVARGNTQWSHILCRRTQEGQAVVVCVDRTAAEMVEMELKRQSLEYYTLVQNIPDFISRVSLDLHFTFVNNRFAASLGKEANQIIGRPILEFAPDDEKEPFVQALRSLTRDKPIHAREQYRTSADGADLWISWCNIAIFDQDRLVEYVTVGRDVTHLKQQEARIAEQRAELQRKNDALNQFTGTVSHDLKAPLRHLAMFSDMISEDVKNGQFDEIPTYARHLRQSALRMDRLIASLLEYAQLSDRIQTWRHVSLRDVVDETLVDLDGVIRDEGARIEVAGLPQVRGDPELLRRLFQNIIGNAIKYRRQGIAPIVRIHADMSSASIRICFEDNGIGIDPKFGKKIFDVFQRLHRDETTYPGTGIGLALAKRIAESHGGTIELDSTFTEGARFVLTLPASVEGRRE